MLPITRSSLRFDLITAVPLHAQRERERGYNQAELVAQQTARLVHGSYLPTLQRTRATTDQVGLDLYARRANVQDAFAVIYPHIQKKRVLLIDDVRTTGATLDACAAALFQSGAEAVYGLTLTHPRLAA
jgi:ComF family protein